MRVLRRCLLCLGCLFIPLLKAQELPLPTLSESETLHFQMLVEGNNRFAFDLYQHMKQQSGNLYFSPYSIAAGLSLVSIGAKGVTAQAFQHAFRYSPALLLFIGDLNESLQKSSASKNTAQVLLANAVWIDKSIPLLPSFKQTFLRNFRTPLQPIDFANDLSLSIQKINQWVSQQTQGKVGNMLSGQDVNVNTRIVLTTAAYLKGSWTYPFDQRSTKRIPFQVSPQRALLTDMMQNTSNYLLWKGEQWDVLAVPYERGDQGAHLTMVILLPKKDVLLNALEKNLTWENWQQWKGQLQNQSVALTLPRFRIDKRLDLEIVLKGLGFSSMFTPEANFSAMTAEKGIHINKAIHKTSIKLDEKGVDISTVAGLKPASSVKTDEAPYEFIADRPFIFIIWDQKTDSIVFMGRLSQP